MCGIVGLLIKKPELREHLGEWMLPMLIGMTERGPDSAGLAVYTQEAGRNEFKYSLYAPAMNYDWTAVERDLHHHLGSSVEIIKKSNHGILVSQLESSTVKTWLKEHFPELHVLSMGRSMDLYKDIGTPGQVAERYDFKSLQGTHLIGHTRMATESAVTPDRAHPFTAGADFCLVHNGSLSNPYQIRRKLEPLGVHFETDNDTEAACRYLEWRMREGDDLETALKKGFQELDGFFTFLMGTKDEMALVRDPYACKPAIVAETDDYVAISSEFRSLAQLPDIKNARLFEPMPEELYIWKV
ncbi:MAG: glutamine amidotransferase family protein [Burkholderiales bacterium]